MSTTTRRRSSIARRATCTPAEANKVVNLAKQAIVSCPHVSIFHFRAANLHDQKYMAGSLRFKEHLYARALSQLTPRLKELAKVGLEARGRRR